MNFIIQETCYIYTTSIFFVNPGQKSSKKYKTNCADTSLVLFN